MTAAAAKLAELLAGDAEPIEIMGVIGWQVRRLYAAKIAEKSGRGVPFYGDPRHVERVPRAEDRRNCGKVFASGAYERRAPVRGVRHEAARKRRDHRRRGNQGISDPLLRWRAAVLKIKEAIVVEGGTIRSPLEPLVDTAIFTTDGFGIFKNKESSPCSGAWPSSGLIVLTDADGAGSSSATVCGRDKRAVSRMPTSRTWWAGRAAQAPARRDARRGGHETEI